MIRGDIAIIRFLFFLIPSARITGNTRRPMICVEMAINDVMKDSFSFDLESEYIVSTVNMGTNVAGITTESVSGLGAASTSIPAMNPALSP